MSHVKIIATIGPQCRELCHHDAVYLRQAFDIGSHPTVHMPIQVGSFVCRSNKTASKAARRTVSIMLDLQGPRIRVGDLPKEGITLSEVKNIFLRHGKALKKNGIPLIPSMTRYLHL